VSHKPQSIGVESDLSRPPQLPLDHDIDSSFRRFPLAVQEKSMCCDRDINSGTRIDRARFEAIRGWTRNY
jgi:hypothetical protein